MTTSNDNTAIGCYALTSGTSGHSNFAGGVASLNDCTTGYSNVAVGYFAGYSINSGNRNTIIGHGAGDTMTTAQYNTIMGFDAGNAVTTGGNNLLLGKNAGVSGSPGGSISTGSSTIVLGDENMGSCNIQTDWTVASDERDKTDFTDLDIGLDFVKALAPVTYKWDKRAKYGDKTADDYDLNAQTPDGTHKEDWLDVGFKAQDVETLEKAAGYKMADKTNLMTSLTTDGKQYGLQYSKFIPILVNAIQELSAEVEKLKGG